MAEGLLVTPRFVRTVNEDHQRLMGEPLNRPQKRARYPVMSASGGIKFYKLTGAAYIYRGSHLNGVAAEEVRASSLNGGRVVWSTVRTGVTLYCGSNGVYVQRDGGTIGNDPGDPGGGDPNDPPPCPPYCTFTGNSSIVAAAETAPSWKFLGSAAAAQTAGSFATTTTSSVFAVTGMNKNGMDFTIGQWESTWVGVTAGDITAGYGNVTIDGIGTIAASMVCSDAISEGSAVQVIFRELGGVGGFAIVGRICCPGYDV